MEKKYTLELPSPFNTYQPLLIPTISKGLGKKMGLSSPTISSKTTSGKQIFMLRSVQGLPHTPILCASTEMKFKT